jgi:hypothetical protein
VSPGGRERGNKLLEPWRRVSKQSSRQSPRQPARNNSITHRFIEPSNRSDMVKPPRHLELEESRNLGSRNSKDRAIRSRQRPPPAQPRNVPQQPLVKLAQRNENDLGKSRVQPRQLAATAHDSPTIALRYVAAPNVKTFKLTTNVVFARRSRREHTPVAPRHDPTPSHQRRFVAQLT